MVIYLINYKIIENIDFYDAFSRSSSTVKKMNFSFWNSDDSFGEVGIDCYTVSGHQFSIIFHISKNSNSINYRMDGTNVLNYALK